MEEGRKTEHGYEWEYYRIKRKALDNKPELSVVDTLAEAFDCERGDVEYKGTEESER